MSQNSGLKSSSSPIPISQHFNLLLFALNITMSDEEPVDQKRILEDRCKPKCVRQLRSYESCIDRIIGDDSGTKHCTGQYFDYYQCVDKCVAPELFKRLK